MSNPYLIFSLFLTLVMGHFFGDFGLQSDRMACEKCPGQSKTLGWGWWLGSHAAIHGFIVALVTGVPLLGLAETLVHFLIDLAKCRRVLRLSMDQALHISVKLVWAFVAVAVAGAPSWLS